MTKTVPVAESIAESCAALANQDTTRADLDTNVTADHAVLKDTVAVLKPPWFRRFLGWVDDHAVTLAIGAGGGYIVARGTDRVVALREAEHRATRGPARATETDLPPAPLPHHARAMAWRGREVSTYEISKREKMNAYSRRSHGARSFSWAATMSARNAPKSFSLTSVCAGTPRPACIMNRMPLTAGPLNAAS